MAAASAGIAGDWVQAADGTWSQGGGGSAWSSGGGAGDWVQSADGTWSQGGAMKKESDRDSRKHAPY